MLKKRLIDYTVLLAFLALSACAAAPVKEAPKIFWPKAPDPPRIAFVSTWDEPGDVGVEPGWFQKVLQFIFGKERTPYVIRPSGVAVDGAGGVYVADTGLQVVHHFDAKKHTYRQVFRVSPTQRLQNPIGVAVDATGQLYVSDADLNRIFVFNAEGEFQHVIGNDKEIKRVSGIALDRNRERLYAVDTMGHRVLVYSLSGKHQGTIGKRGVAAGTFNFPTYAAVDAEGQLYVSDSLNFRIQVFNPEGEHQFHFGGLGRNLGEFSRPKGIAVDRDKQIYVVDTLFDTVQVFNPSGELLIHFGKSGMAPGAFWLPSGIAVDREGKIFVADAYNKRLQVFRLLKEGLPVDAEEHPSSKVQVDQKG